MFLLTVFSPTVCFFTGGHELGLQKYEVSKEIIQESEVKCCSPSHLNAQLTFFMCNFSMCFWLCSSIFIRHAQFSDLTHIPSQLKCMSCAYLRWFFFISIIWGPCVAEWHVCRSLCFRLEGALVLVLSLPVLNLIYYINFFMWMMPPSAIIDNGV